MEHYGHFIDMEYNGPTYKIIVQQTNRGYNVAQPHTVYNVFNPHTVYNANTAYNPNTMYNVFIPHKASNEICKAQLDASTQKLAKPLKQKVLATIMENEMDNYEDESDCEDELKPKEWFYITLSAVFIVYVVFLVTW
jgi:hypothetical protein